MFYKCKWKYVKMPQKKLFILQWNTKNHKRVGGKPIHFLNYKLLDNTCEKYIAQMLHMTCHWKVPTGWTACGEKKPSEFRCIIKSERARGVLRWASSNHAQALQMAPVFKTGSSRTINDHRILEKINLVYFQWAAFFIKISKNNLGFFWFYLVVMTKNLVNLDAS